MTAASDVLIWLDMEMTGLDPATCVPLQVALIATTGELVELDGTEVTIHQPESRLQGLAPVVQEMHTKNGLFDAVRASTISVAAAEETMLAFVRRYCGPREGVLAGNSIHQDRRFVTRYFSAFDAYLHYRMVDVSTLKELVRRWYGAATYTKPASGHTALADVRASIAELRHYRHTFMRPEPAA